MSNLISKINQNNSNLFENLVMFYKNKQTQDLINEFRQTQDYVNRQINDVSDDFDDFFSTAKEQRNMGLINQFKKYMTKIQKEGFETSEEEVEFFKFLNKFQMIVKNDFEGKYDVSDKISNYMIEEQEILLSLKKFKETISQNTSKESLYFLDFLNECVESIEYSKKELNEAQKRIKMRVNDDLETFNSLGLVAKRMKNG